MLDRLTRRLYRRLGVRYRFLLPAVQGPAVLLVALVAVAVIASYYDPSLGRLAVVVGATVGFTGVSVAFAAVRSNPFLARVVEWHETERPTAEQTAAAWDAATNAPMRSFRRNSLNINGIAALPSAIVLVLVLGLPWYAGPVVVAASAAPAAYATILSFSIAELFMRPAIEEIARALPEDFPFERRGLPVRNRFVITLPAVTGMTGLIVAAMVADGGGTGLLALSVLGSLGVGLLLSLELTVLLARAITDPIARLRAAMVRVRTGDYDTRLPLVTSDELGELFADFNLMAGGLAERERMRETFGTYVDKEVAGFILSGRFPEEGVEVDVSIMFCDVRGFTRFAEDSEATVVVAALNAMFERIVPIIVGHGGHVDKFIGDGLLAVFGAPEPFADHADRALATAAEIVRTVNRPDAALHVGTGINTGRVVAGSIGGAGRLNFSVVGDAVNVAARVEAATRQTGDDLLITAATRDALTDPVALDSRGAVALKGKSRPVEVLTPRA